MTLGLIFWILMLIWLVFGIYTNYQSPDRNVIGGSVMLFILLLLLGWHTFGAPIQG